MTSKFAIIPAAMATMLCLAAPAVAGIKQNGLSTNGLSSNGLSSNGLSTNGLSTNGLSTNGLSTNGVQINGAAPHARTKAQTLAQPRLREIVLAGGEHVRLK